MQIPFFNRWHPVLALRYLPLIKHIRPIDSILEVGSGSLGIGPYIRRPFVGCDLNFAGPVWSPMTKLISSAQKLPLKNSSFDIVINMDMLEHLPPQTRQQAINELIRVARHTVIIGVPTGKRAHQQDNQLDQLYLKVHGKRHPFLQEQTDFGLPTPNAIIKAIQTAAGLHGKQPVITTQPNINLTLRLWLMKGWISQNTLVNILFRKGMLVLVPLFRLCNQPPTYRTIFFITLSNHRKKTD